MGIAAGSVAQDNWIAVSPCPLCAHIWRLLMSSSVYSMPIFGHAPFVPISLCPYMEIADVIRIQYAHIWAGHASFVAIYEVRQHSLIAKCT